MRTLYGALSAFLTLAGLLALAGGALMAASGPETFGAGLAIAGGGGLGCLWMSSVISLLVSIDERLGKAAAMNAKL